MKPTTTGVAVFSGLAAVVAADALPMDSIPLQCVKVCGPIVELTSICNTNIDARRRSLKRRKVEVSAGVRGPRLHYGRARDDECNGGRCKKEKKAVDPEKRQFSVIRQAPTSFPPELLPPPEETIVARPTRINPVIVTTTSAIPTTSLNPPPPPTDDTNADDEDDAGDDDIDADDGAEDGTDAPAPSTSTSTTSTSTLSGSATLVADASATSTGAAIGNDEEEWWMPDDAEQQCVCMNKSFDVARLTGLCASCVDQTGDPTNNINIIVSTCNFKADETYSRDLDRVADNVRVKATKPTVQMVASDRSGAAMAQEAGSAGSGMVVASRTALVVAAAGVVAWAAMVV